MARAYLRFAAQRRAHYQVMFQWAARTGEITENPTDWHDPAKHSFQVLVDVIAHGQAQGQVRPGRAAELARVVWASVHGLALLPPAPDGGETDLTGLAIEILLQGLRSNSAAGSWNRTLDERGPVSEA